jgi:hypothetical protein
VRILPITHVRLRLLYCSASFHVVYATLHAFVIVLTTAFTSPTAHPTCVAAYLNIARCPASVLSFIRVTFSPPTRSLARSLYRVFGCVLIPLLVRAPMSACCRSPSLVRVPPRVCSSPFSSVVPVVPVSCHVLVYVCVHLFFHWRVHATVFVCVPCLIHPGPRSTRLASTPACLLACAALAFRFGAITRDLPIMSVSWRPATVSTTEGVNSVPVEDL